MSATDADADAAQARERRRLMPAEREYHVGTFLRLLVFAQNPAGVCANLIFVFIFAFILEPLRFKGALMVILHVFGDGMPEGKRYFEGVNASLVAEPRRMPAAVPEVEPEHEDDNTVEFLTLSRIVCNR